MAKYKIREVLEREVELDPGEVLSIAAAAQWLGISVQAVAQAIDRGKLTAVINESAGKRQRRRLVLRKEVEAWAAERGKDAPVDK